MRCWWTAPPPIWAATGQTRPAGAYTLAMAELVRLDFVERDRQWFITEVYADGVTRPGEPFAASAADNLMKFEQVVNRIFTEYREYEVPRRPHEENERRYEILVQRRIAE